MNDHDTNHETNCDDKTVPAHSMPPVSSGMYQEGGALLRSGMLMPPQSPGALGTIGKYQVVRILGEGGMGQVLLAREPVTVSLVAIKMIKPEFLNKGWAVHRFLTEARHMFRMSHAAIIRVLDVSDRPEGPYFVMPYMSGGSLADKIKPGEALPPETILPIARAVAEALHHAHSHGITHRDIKPSNILLDSEDRAHLADFGLLRTFHNDTIIDAAQPRIEGTVPYMSPAVAAGKAEDTRCDIYAFGCLLYEMLTGRPPYQGATVDAILKQIQDGPPPPVRQLNPQAPANLTAIAEHAMARELRDRYATMGDVVADLERAASGKEPIGPHGREMGSSNTRKVMVVVGIMALVALAAFGISRLPFWKSSGNTDGSSTQNTTRVAPAGKIAAGTGKVIDLGGGVTMEFVLIQPGSFMMGSDEGTTAIEGVPVHKVTLTKPYGIGKYEVTQEQWEKIMGANPSYFQGPKNPVDSVTWNDCQSFVAKLNAKVSGRLFRLPTEAEWEYACRAGATGAYCFREGEGSLADYAWSRSNADNTNHPVGQKKPNAWGLHDMHGNVVEWCADWYGEYPASAVTDPQGPSSGSRRVHRGSCNKSTFRGWDRQEFIENTHGLRLALDAVPGDNLPPATPLVEVPFSYTVKDGAVTITKYTGPGGQVMIDEKINNQPVIAIGVGAFSGSAKLTGVTIPASVAIIAKEAFSGCTGLTAVYFKGNAPGGGADASVFTGDDNANIYYLPGTKGWTETFAGRPALFQVQDYNCSVKDGAITIAKYTGNGGNVVIPDKIEGLPVTTIGDSAFNGNAQLTSVKISNSVTYIGFFAFGDCTKLTSVNIPASVTSIRWSPFAGCTGLTSIPVDEANTAYSSKDGVLFNKDQTYLLNYPAGKAGVYEIPSTVGQLGCSSFMGCSKLTEVTMPDYPNILPNGSVFYGCTALTKVTLPNRLTRIGSWEFTDCTSLASITVPASVSTTGRGVFRRCPNLTAVYFMGNAPKTDDGSIFSGTTKATVYYLPETMGWGKEFLGRPTALWDAKSMLAYTVNNNAITITKYIGSGGGIVIPDKINGVAVTAIGRGALDGCDNVTGLTIPESMTFIDALFFGFFGGGKCSNVKVDAANPAYCCIDGVIFSKDKTSLVKCLPSKTGAYAIPETVANIGLFAFHGCSGLTDITIPASVRRIGNNAFGHCYGCKNITILPGVTNFDYCVFYYCTALSKVSLPSSVISMGDSPFRCCFELKSIVVDVANPAYCSSTDGVLFDKEKAAIVMCPPGKDGSYVIPDSVTQIKGGAFRGCGKLTSVTVPDRVASVGTMAFQYCRSLTEVIFKGNAPTLGTDVFGAGSNPPIYHLPAAAGWTKEFGGRPTAVWGPKAMPQAPSATQGAQVPVPGSGPIPQPDGPPTTPAPGVAPPTAMAAGPFTYTTTNDAVTITKYTGQGGDVVIPDKINELAVTIIGDDAFANCANLTGVTIPKSVTTIGNHAFGSCTNLTGVRMQDGVTTINSWAFQLCQKLKNVRIPASVKDIGDACFAGCNGLTSIDVDTDNAAFSCMDGVLFNKEKTCLVSYAGGKGVHYVIPNNVTSIGSWSFAQCYNIVSVTIPDSVTNIGNGVFWWCRGLTDVTIPGSVTMIGCRAFQGCTELTSIVIPDGVTILDRQMFKACGKLTHVTLPAKLTNINNDAFLSCSNLATMTIPANVSSIGDTTFGNCSALTEVFFKGNAPGLGAGTFQGADKATIYYLPTTKGWTKEFGGLPTAVWEQKAR